MGGFYLLSQGTSFFLCVSRICDNSMNSPTNLLGFTSEHHPNKDSHSLCLISPCIWQECVLLQDLRFSWWWKQNSLFSELLCHTMWWLNTNISEDHAASIFRIELQEQPIKPQILCSSCSHTSHAISTFKCHTGSKF